MKSLIVLFSILSASIISIPVAASAKTAKKIKCKAYSIVASEKKGKLPKELKQFKHIFSKIPFKMFGSFKLLVQSNLQLGAKTVQGRLSKKLFLTVKLLDRILSSTNKKRYRIKLQIRKKVKAPKKKSVSIYNMVMKLSSNKPMFIAGPKEGGGTLVIGLICK